MATELEHKSINELTELFKMLLFARSGVGKTVFLATCLDVPELLPALYVDVDNSASSIRSKLRYCDTLRDLGSPEPGKIDAYRVRKWMDFVDLYNALADNQRLACYRLLQIDSGTELQKYAIRWASKNDNYKLSSEMPSQPEYGAASQLMNDLLRSLRDWDLNLIITAQPKNQLDSSGNLLEITPAFVGQLAYEAPSLVPLVGFLELSGLTDKDGKKKRNLTFDPTTTLLVKDQSEDGRLGGKIAEPTLRCVYDLLNKKR